MARKPIEREVTGEEHAEINMDLLKAHLEHVAEICEVLAESVMTQSLGSEDDVQEVFDALKEAASVAESTARAL